MGTGTASLHFHQKENFAVIVMEEYGTAAKLDSCGMGSVHASQTPVLPLTRNYTFNTQSQHCAMHVSTFYK